MARRNEAPSAQDLLDEEDPIEDDPIEDEDPDEEDPDGNDEEDPVPSKKFTQEDVNRFLSKEKKKTRRTIEEVLGMSVDDAVEALRAVASGQKPEVQAQLDRREEQLTRREDEIIDRELQLTVRERLQDAGCRPSRVKRAVRLVDLDEDFDEQDINDAIEDLKGEFPELFAPEPVDEPDDTRTRGRTGRGRTSAPRVPRKKTQPAEDAFNKGAQMAAQFGARF